jgi:hypothetical protein
LFVGWLVGLSVFLFICLPVNSETQKYSTVCEVNSRRA